MEEHRIIGEPDRQPDATLGEALQQAWGQRGGTHYEDDVRFERQGLGYRDLEVTDVGTQGREGESRSDFAGVEHLVAARTQSALERRGEMGLEDAIENRDSHPAPPRRGRASIPEVRYMSVTGTSPTSNISAANCRAWASTWLLWTSQAPP